MLEIKNVYKTFNAGTVNEKIALKGLDLTECRGRCLARGYGQDRH